MNRVRLVLAALVALAPGCAREPSTDADTNEPGSDAANAAREAAPIATGSEAYLFGRDDEVERTSIDFVYDNRGTDTLYQPTCRVNGAGDPGLSMAIQKSTAEGWSTVWVPVLPACLSEPIIVPPGAAYRDTFEVVLHPQDTAVQPLLNTEVDVEGRYRLLWQQLLRDYDPARYPFGEEAAESARVSNPFTLGR